MSGSFYLGRLSAPVPKITRRKTEEIVTTDDGPPRLERLSTKSVDLTRESLSAYLERRSPLSLERTSMTPSLARAASEIARRTELPLQCAISVSLVDVHSREGVYYKFDGSRFQYSDATVKVVTGSTYELSLTMKPQMDIVPNVLHVRSVMHDGVPRQSVVFLNRSRLDGGKSLIGHWKCDLDVNRKSERVEVILSGQLAQFGMFDIPLLMKVYSPSRKNALHGFKLRLVVFEVKRRAGEESGLVQLNSVRYMS